ncbi:peptidase M14 [Salinimicrobium marinum]|uniref:Peptidase M14 n=1 Tax=Salinimicrobium marinum TaxID=680283 RepID=A0A918SCD1_9FLAO|nr:M14 family zinc carboxypeptidase [Salinimicrobium marinum]GHA31657.1 peptidase M14 [Salinimicrobium marinum]
MKTDTIFASIIDRYSSIKNSNLYGRYITYNDIAPELENLSSEFLVEKIGESVLKTPVHSVTFGNGPIKILGWSQMHGNESTTTKAAFDLFNLFVSEKQQAGISAIPEKCTIKIIPMLNPDGAIRYTRENVNGVDLNRDASELKEDESRILRHCYEDYKPDFCLNLHDQRTIFGAGDTNKPATLSFLAPSMDAERSISGNRKDAMQLIAAINKDMQQIIPAQVGRYDDAFNLQCTGDSFQKSGVPTILFEAGHFSNDYFREKTREFVAISILSAIHHITENDFSKLDVEDYFKIPENEKNFFDVILRKAEVEGEVLDVAIQFEEKIKAGKICFDPVVKKIEKDLSFFGHQEIQCEGEKVTDLAGGAINENAVVNQILLKNNKLSIKVVENVQ